MGKTIDVSEAMRIMAKITTSGGKLKTNFPWHKNEPKPYFVWRIARLLGGVDVSEPVLAMMCARQFEAELDIYLDFAEQVADQFFSKNEASLRRLQRFRNV